MNNTTTTWRDLWAMYFFRLTDEEADMWESEMLGTIKRLNHDEIIRAVRSLSMQDRRGRPTLKDLRCRIYTERKDGRSDEAPPESCGLCSGGLVEVWPEATTGPWTIETLAQEYSFSGPCQCAAGQRVSMFQPALSNELFALARRQHAGIAESAEAECAAVQKEGRYA